ncbi:hypothetical protein N0V86_003778 [Didymella sp. IMI 355093]|nr:hypothetical protein N0V86_003778 [Didymella sp. IMI 355093]
MFPMVSAGQTDQTNLKYSGWFQKLHTLEFDMQGQCGTWLIQLLSLPSLKSLSLRSWGIKPYDDWEASLVWPEPTATSVVHNLNLWNTSVTSDVIVRIMDYCVALRSFRCNRALDNRFGTGVRGRQWCVEILAGLQRHNQTLASLDLDPYDTHDRFYLQEEYGRVDGFQQLVALNSLNVPWHVIMGSPAGVKNAQDHWKPVEDFTYLNMRDILPKNLRHLKIHKSDHSTPDCTGIEQALNSLLPASDADTGALLNRLEFIYDNAHYYKPLPMNFWRIQSAFQAAGCAFSYKLKLDPSDFCKPRMTDSYGLKQQVNQFADTLAKEGVAGVQTALRTGVLGLPERVMELVGLGKEWLDTEEAKEVLFGEKVDTWSKRGINF